MSRKITVTLNEGEIEDLERLAEWLNCAKETAYTQRLHDMYERWQETIESILEEEE